jgi:hypothetical protein
MRALLRWMALVTPIVSLLGLGCSPSPGSPTLPAGADGRPVTREYPYECALPEPGNTSGTPTFSAVYGEIISDGTGAAKCQNGACHGGGAANGDLSLGTTKQDAFCGMAAFVLIQPHDCTSCDFCAAEIAMATAGACGDDAGINHACCVPCGGGGTDAGADGESDAASDAAPEAGAASEVPIEVAGLHDVVTERKGASVMPKTLCGNRLLNDDDRKMIDDWGRKGAPLD